MLRNRFAAAGLAFALLGSIALSAQVSRPQPKIRNSPAPRPKLTPQQQVGLSILDQQLGVAKGLAPVMRSFALLEIAQGYQKLERPKALAALRDAFQASQAIPEDSDPHGRTRQSLQTHIISRLVALDPAYCEQLIPQLAGPARRTAIDFLVSHYAHEKQFASAVALLNQLADQEFPYTTVSRLMQDLPPEMAADKQNLFSQALASYSQHEHKNNLDDFADFIARTWQGLPPDLVRQAVDQVLKQARQSDSDMQITVGAEKGSASFKSLYEYTLFELMPVLRTLDPERAGRLLQENRDLQSTVRQFPNGLSSLDPQHGMPQSLTIRVSGGAESGATDLYAAQLQSQTRQIVNQATKNPKQALAAAMSLPDFHDTRAMTLLLLAEAIAKTSPGYARDALSELLKLVPSVQQDFRKAGFLEQAGDDYLKLGDTDSAKKVVDQGLKVAEELYSTDTDANDPNQAFKAEWPSTSTWARFVALAARISPATALQAISNIPDSEIQSLETIALANSLLGVPPGFQVMEVRTKSGKNNYMMTSR